MRRDLTITELARLAARYVQKQANLLPQTSLQPHQQRVADSGHDEESRQLLYHALGSGKTLASIAAAENAGDPYTAIVPASLRPNFNKEREKWTDQKVPVSLTSYNAMARGTGPTDTDTLIVDEAQRLRNEESQQTRATTALADKAKHVYLLSGTPIVNRPADLAPLMSILRREPMAAQQFNDLFVGEKTVSPGLWGWLRGVPPAKVQSLKNEALLRQELKGHVDYQPPRENDLGVKEEEYTVDMSPEQHRLYQGFWDKLPWMMRWKLQRNFPLTHQEMRNLNSFLAGPRQVSLSTLPFMRGNSDPVKAFEQSPKLQKALSLVQESMKTNPNFQGAAFSNFIDAGLKPYAAALERAGIPSGMFHGQMSDEERRKVVDLYNKQKLRMILLGPAGGEGISLKGTRALQVLDPHWNEARSDQAIGRGIRFDSHSDLPPDQRNIVVQRFMSAVPHTFAQKLFGPNEAKNRDGSDFYLRQLSQRKDDLNQQFLKVLQDVGRHA